MVSVLSSTFTWVPGTEHGFQDYAALAFAYLDIFLASDKTLKFSTAGKEKTKSSTHLLTVHYEVCHSSWPCL